MKEVLLFADNSTGHASYLFELEPRGRIPNPMSKYLAPVLLNNSNILNHHKP